MFYMDLSLLPADYEIVQTQEGEFICAPDGTLYKFQRNTSTYIQYEVDFINWNHLPKGWNNFRSRSGEFICDSEGRLRKFILCHSNAVTHAGALPYERILKNLIIPEGVRQIGPVCSKEQMTIEAFRHVTVLDEIRFPDSLKVMGSCSFANSTLPSVTFPVSLEKLDAFAFGGSIISKLTIPSNMKNVIIHFSGVIDPTQNPPEGVLWIVGRDFKAAVIDILACPEDFKKSPLMPEAEIGQIIHDRPIKKKHRKGLLQFLSEK